MQIRGIHIRGLRSPAGEHHHRLEEGYNALPVSDREEARALADLLAALLQPDSLLRDLHARADPASGGPARVDLPFAHGSEVYRLVADATKSRLALGRWDPEERRHQRMSTDPREIAGFLRSAGVPPADVFQALHRCGLEAPPPAAPGPPAPARRLVEESRERREALERELAEARAELVKRQILEGRADALEERMDQFQEILSRRERELGTIEASRRTLLDERMRLRVQPRAQRFPVGIGLVMAGAGLVAGWLGFTVAYLVGVGGGLLAGAGLLRVTRAERRLRRVEGQLAAMRVRERGLERHFESEGAAIRTVLKALELDSLEDLQREIARFRELRARATALERELEVLEEAAAIAPPEEAPAVPEVAPPPALAAERDPDELVRAAAAWTGRSPDDIVDALRAPLALYLRLLGPGEPEQLRRRELEGWVLRCGAPDQEPTPFRNLEPVQRERVLLSVRLALLEALAPSLRAPLLAGPEPLLQDERGRAALRRLAESVQVLHLVHGAPPQAT